MKKKWTIGLIGGLVVLAGVLVFIGMKGCEIETTVEPSSNIVPPSKEWFLENSDIISYVEVLEVDRKIEEKIEKDATIEIPPNAIEIPPVGKRTISPKQHAKVKFLKVLKGAKELEGSTANIVKRKSFFYLTEKERLVLYLTKPLPLCSSYRVIGPLGGEWRLTSALAIANSLKKDKTTGIVIGILNKGTLEEDLKVHVLQGKHKAPVTLGNEIYKDNLMKIEEINELDIAEILLKPGSYTVLIELNGNLYSFNRLVDGYYPYVVLEKDNGRNWQSIYFDLNKVE